MCYTVQKHHYSAFEEVEMDNLNLVNSYSLRKIHFPDKHITGNVKFKIPCIGYVLRGSGCFLYKGATHVAHSGDLIYIAAGTKYYSVWSGDEADGSGEIEFYTMSFSFSSPYAYSEYKFQLIKDYPAERFDLLYHAWIREDTLEAMSHFYSILSDVYPRLSLNEGSSRFTSISPAIEYIETNFKENISVEELARVCYCSESAIYKLFSETVGVSPIHYKHNMMIQHALHLLSNTDMSIEEISAESGFSSSNYFRKIFRSVTGSNPNDLRKRNRK